MNCRFQWCFHSILNYSTTPIKRSKNFFRLRLLTTRSRIIRYVPTRTDEKKKKKEKGRKVQQYTFRMTTNNNNIHERRTTSSFIESSIILHHGMARFITSPQCNSVVALTGTRESIASGIPDFSSPGGMYDTLRPDLITAEPL